MGQTLSLFTYELYFEVGHARNTLRTVQFPPQFILKLNVLVGVASDPALAALFPFYYQRIVFVIRQCIDDFVLHQQQISVQKG